MNIVLEGYILVSDADLNSVLKELPTHIELTRAEDGCMSFEVLQDKSNHNKFHVNEKFTNRAAFEAHQKRVSESMWGTISKNVERHYSIKEVMG